MRATLVFLNEAFDFTRGLFMALSSLEKVAYGAFSDRALYPPAKAWLWPAPVLPPAQVRQAARI
jgi:hypothetical protein